MWKKKKRGLIKRIKTYSVLNGVRDARRIGSNYGSCLWDLPKNHLRSICRSCCMPECWLPLSRSALWLLAVCTVGHYWELQLSGYAGAWPNKLEGCRVNKARRCIAEWLKAFLPTLYPSSKNTYTVPYDEILDTRVVPIVVILLS